MRARVVSLGCVLVALYGCRPLGVFVDRDAAPETSTDARIGDVSSDTVADNGTETSVDVVADVAPDVAMDVAPDVVVVDVVPDAAMEASMPDVFVMDERSDVLVESGAESAEEASVDVVDAADVQSDLAMDVSMDVSMDAAMDASMDAAMEASMPDVVNDVDVQEAGGCPPLAMRPMMTIPSMISADTTLSCRFRWLMDSYVRVINGATLRVEAGTVVFVSGSGALLVTRGARLDADGTASQPIAFVSNPPAGAPFDSGAWAGISLLGNARVNGPTTSSQVFSTVFPGDSGWAAGGTDDTWSCGRLRYVRIEFAGGPVLPGSTVKSTALLLAGCGSGTVLDHVQVHRSLDYAFRFIGGTVDLRYAIASDYGSDGFVWERGWRGRGQFLIARSRLNSNADDGLDGDNFVDDPSSMPVSNPLLSHVTLYGAYPSAIADGQAGINLGNGTRGIITNALVLRNHRFGINFKDSLTGSVFASGYNFVTRSLFFTNGAGGATHITPSLAGALGRTGAFNRFDLDPGIALQTEGTPMRLAPSATGPAASGAALPADSFFTPASYIGAVPPTGVADDWTTGWTNFADTPRTM